MLVDRAIYRDGRRLAEPIEFEDTDDAFRADGGLAWVGLYRPTEQELNAIAAEFGVHDLAVRDAERRHERPKLERRHGDILFCLRRALESRPDLLQRGPVAILHAIMNRVLDDYAPVVAGVENDIDEIEDEVFNGSAGAPRRGYELSREGIGFQRATKPLTEMLADLMAETDVEDEEHRYLRDVHDHAVRVQERADEF